MKLPYGLLDGNFVHISEVDSGRTDVHCSYCQKQLIAKKGTIKRHHFAHDGVSCTPSFTNKLFGLQGRLPLQSPLCIYAERKKSAILKKLNTLENTYLSLQQQQAAKTTLIPELLFHLERLVTYYTDRQLVQKATQIQTLLQEVKRFIQQKVAPFPSFHLIRGTPFTAAYTDGQKKCSAAQVEEDRYEFFYPISFNKYVECLKNYHQIINLSELSSNKTLFQQELNYFNQFDLYFLEIQADGQLLYKIGLTSRTIQTRLNEIQLDLQQHFTTIQLKLLFLKKGVAFIETFFKQKYAASQILIGSLTEYFSFPPPLLSLLSKDFECLALPHPPKRINALWVYWAYFHSNKKLYGYQTKSIYVGGEKVVLSKEEARIVERVMSRKEL